MKAEYDFSKGKRGLFHQANAKGVLLNEMVNALLKQEIQLIESVK